MSVSILFCLSAVIALAGCVIIMLIICRRLKRSCEILEESCHNLENLNFHLRAARHDSMNHLQVALGLVELEEYEELKAYLKPVCEEMMKTQKANKTSKPALNALLQAKYNEASGCGIDFYTEIHSSLDGLSIKDWELCRVLSNLIDNAITALKEDASASDKKKKLEFEITEDAENCYFQVSDNGSFIPPENLAKIYKKGFSTKKEDGHGLGLSIVTDILRENNGKIEASSKPDKTTFTVTLPKTIQTTNQRR